METETTITIVYDGDAVKCMNCPRCSNSVPMPPDNITISVCDKCGAEITIETRKPIAGLNSLSICQTVPTRLPTSPFEREAVFIAERHTEYKALRERAGKLLDKHLAFTLFSICQHLQISYDMYRLTPLIKESMIEQIRGHELAMYSLITKLYQWGREE